MDSELGSILVEAGVLTPNQLSQALSARHRQGRSLLAHLIESRLVEEDQLVTLFCTRRNYRRAAADDLAAVPPEILSLVPPHLAWRHGVIPLSLEGDALYLATADPSDTPIQEQLAYLTGYRVTPLVTRYSTIQQALARAYGDDGSSFPPGYPPPYDPYTDQPWTSSAPSDDELVALLNGADEAAAVGTLQGLGGSPRPPTGPRFRIAQELPRYYGFYSAVETPENGPQQTLRGVGAVDATPTLRAPSPLPPHEDETPTLRVSIEPPVPESAPNTISPEMEVLLESVDENPADLIKRATLAKPPAPKPKPVPVPAVSKPVPAVSKPVPADPKPAPKEPRPPLARADMVRRFLEKLPPLISPRPVGPLFGPPEDLIAALGTANHIHAVLDSVFGYLAPAFPRQVFFLIRPGVAQGFRGVGLPHPAPELRVPLNSSSLFTSILLSQFPFVGELLPTPATRPLLQRLGMPCFAVLLPILLGDRAIGVFFGDRGDPRRGADGNAFINLRRVSAATSHAIVRLLQQARSF